MALPFYASGHCHFMGKDTTEHPACRRTFLALFVEGAQRVSSNCTLRSENPLNNCEQKFVGGFAANARSISFSKSL
jgi:hypothetical protein